MNVDRIDQRLACAALAMAGVVLALLAVYIGTGLHDGFGDWDLHRIRRRFRRALPWAVPLAGLGGYLLWRFYERMLQPEQSGLVILVAIVRAFAHFPLFGALALLALVWGFAATLGKVALHLAKWGSLGDEGDGESMFERWLGPPVWFMFMPFIALKLPMEGDMEIPDTVSRPRLLRWLPAVLALILLFTDASDGDTGERIDSYMLAAFAGFWLADYLIVALRITPLLRARERAGAA
jgi:hypothetical protein